VKPVLSKTTLATLMICALVVAGLHATRAIAQELTKWADAGQWQVLVDPSVGYGCLMEKIFDDGTRMRMGSLPERKGGFLSIVNKDWTHIDKVATVVVQFDLDGEVFAGDVDYIIEGDLRGGYAFFNNPALVDVFGKKHTVTITGPTERSVSYSLSGTIAALQAIGECRKEYAQ
jgi:hypothetical protein